jgi:hypothetical protein
MKEIAIGDVHGIDVINIHKDTLDAADKIIFIGDYVDSYERTDEQHLNTLNNILQYKKDNYDRVVLLLGNHDIQYFTSYRYSGFRLSMYSDLNQIFLENMRHFVYFHLSDEETDGVKYLYSHAGITHDFATRNGFLGGLQADISEGLFNMSIAFNRDYSLLNQTGKRSNMGDFYNGSPIWATMNELIRDPLELNIHQVVGHTYTKDIVVEQHATFIDCLYNGKIYQR